jgi:hypothetical protein
MPIYKFTVEIANEVALTKCIKYILRCGQLGAAVCVDSEERPPLEVLAKPRGNPKDARDQEIIDKYTANPKKYSSQKLGDEYGISRERVCQILRPVNAIGNAQERRATAKAALAESTNKLKEETIALWETKMQEALALVQKGVSHRKAVAQVGMGSHSQFTNQLGKRATLMGIRINHGRHRDFSE